MSFKKKARFIRTFFERKMLSVHKKAVRFCELVNVHPKTRGKALGIPFPQIDKTGLTTTGATALAVEGNHRENGWRRVDGENLTPSSIHHPAFEALF